MKKLSDLECSWQPTAEQSLNSLHSESKTQWNEAAATVSNRPRSPFSKSLAGWGLALGVSLVSAPALLNYYGLLADGGYSPVPEIIQEATAAPSIPSSAVGGQEYSKLSHSLAPGATLSVAPLAQNGTTLSGRGWDGDYLDPEIVSIVEKTADEIISPTTNMVTTKVMVPARIPEMGPVETESTLAEPELATVWSPADETAGSEKDTIVEAFDSDGWQQVASLGPLDQRSKAIVDTDSSAAPAAVSTPAISVVSDPPVVQRTVDGFKPLTTSPAALAEALEPLLLKGQENKPLTLDFAYSVQVGAFLEREGAFRRASKLRRQGYNAYVLELWGIKDPSRLWQSVRIGRFDDAHAAYAAAYAFKQKEGIGAYATESDSFSGVKLSKPVAKTVANHRTVSQVEKVRVETARVGKTEEKKHVVSLPPAVDTIPRTPTKMEKRKTVAQPPRVKASTQPLPAGPAKPPEPLILKRTVSASAKTQENKKALVERAAVPLRQPPVQQRPAVKASEKAPWMVAKATPIEKTSKIEFFEGSARTARVERHVVDDVKPTASVAQSKPSQIKPTVAAAKSVPVTAMKQTTVANSQATVEDAERLYDQSEDARRRGDQAGEEKLLLLTIKKDVRHARARRRLARLFVESDRSGKALSVLQEAVEGRTVGGLVEEDPNLAAFLAALYQRQEDHWRAIDYYENLLNQYPRKGIWRMGMAISLEKVNEPKDALKAYQLALSSGGLNRKLQGFVQKRIQKLQ